MKHGVVLGRTRCGKTRWTEKLSVTTVAIGTPVRVIFFNTQWEQLGGLMVTEYDSLIALLEESRKRNVFINFYPSRGGEDLTQLEDLIEHLFEYQATDVLGETILVIDEIDKYCTKHYIPPSVKDLWTKGLRFGIVAIGISQRPQLVHNDILTQSFWMVLFDMSELDKDWFARNVLPQMMDLDFSVPYTAYFYDYKEVRKVQ